MMSQLKRIICLGMMVSILGLMTAVPLQAAEPQADKANWDNLKQLPQDVQVRVVLNDAKSYVGQFRDANDQGILIRTTAGEQTFSRESILRVSTKTASHRGRNAGFGALAGLGAGIGIGAAASQGSEIPLVIYVISVSIGIGAGAAVGAAIHSGGWREAYRAPGRQTARS